MPACGTEMAGGSRNEEGNEGEEGWCLSGALPGEDLGCQATPQGIYKAGGAKFTFHGMDYQFQLLMLFAIRALNQGYSHFSLATEMSDALKLDDVVFSYAKVRTSTRRYFRFLQAKHHVGQVKKISVADLLDEGNGKMSLKQYFHSFRNISRNRSLLGENGRIEDLIICTNMDFNYGSESGGLKLKEDVFEAVVTEAGEECEDDILKVVLVKFKKEFEGREEIVRFLRKNAVEIPREFALSLLKRRKYIHKKCDGVDQLLHDKYTRVLFGEVIDPSCDKLRDDFIQGENLSTTATHFREVITELYLRQHQDIKHRNEESLCSFLARAEVFLSGNRVQPENCILNPKSLSKKLTELIRRNRDGKHIKVGDEDSLVARNAVALCTGAWERKECRFQFREEFLAGTQVTENLSELRDCLVERLRFLKMNVTDLGGYIFDIPIPSLIARSGGRIDSLEEDIDTFLDKLVFAVKYPGVSSLEDMIMSEISKIFNPAHKKNVFSRFSQMVQQWLMEEQGRVLGRVELRAFFDGLKDEMEGSLKFHLGDPVASFSGRREELSHLRKMLLGDLNEGENRRAVEFVHIVGPGGVGKSELAKKHAQENLSHYKSVMWVDAGFREHMEDSFLRLAFETLGISKVNEHGEVKDINSVVKEVYDYYIGKTCLFVFDDVAPDSDLNRFLPRPSRVSHIAVIITSRNGDWNVAEKLNLGGLTSEESTEFFKNTIGYSSIFNADEAKKLAEVLHHIPLALHQAAYYIGGRNLSLSSTQFRIADYLVLLERKRTETASCYFGNEPEDLCWHPKYITILITRDFIGNLEHGKDALKILNMIAYMSPGSIAVDFVTRLLRGNAKPALESLKECNFISIRNSELTVDLSVALVTRKCLRKMEEEEGVLREVLETGLPLKLGHLHTLWSNSVIYVELVKKFSHVSMKIMDAFTRRSLDQRALEYGRNAINVLSTNVGTDYTVISILYKMAGEFRNIENRHKSEILRTRFFTEYFELKNDENDIKSLIRQGLLLILMHGYDEALKVFVSVFTNRIGVNAPFLFNIAKFYIVRLRKISQEGGPNEISKELEEYSKCILRRNEMMVRELVDHENEVGRLREQLFSHYALAELMKQERRYFDAFKLMEQNYDLCESILGESSVISLWIKKELAVLLLYMGDVNRAVNVLQGVCNLLRILLDVTNLYFLQATRLYALALSRSGRHMKALQYYEESCNYYSVALGELHEVTLNVNAYICIEWLLLGRTDKAVSALKPVSALDNPEYFRILLSQGKRLVKLGKAADALYVLIYVQGAFEESYEEDSLETLEITLEVGLAYLQMGGETSLQRGKDYLIQVKETLEFYSSDREDVRRMKFRAMNNLIQSG